eukprot:CAMPEP_0172838120 /NCGR_PEP_ID=MMETSP1075-20121228/27656_1 /TAXON_ID=2916 /ORGANISM="Ceratium fusus, Strain PA161109" /LENGTH=101 /DNA_ID=CAMNT_0013681589 /DNA_START=315 /DNA_END=617 /DNA_ORIENTATION=+
MAILGSNQQRRVSILSRLLLASTAEHLHDLYVSILGGKEERCRPILHRMVLRYPSVTQHLHDVDVAVLGSDEQGCRSIVLRLVLVCASVTQHLHDLCAAPL